MPHTILHDENLTRVPLFGGVLRRQLERRVDETRTLATGNDPDMSILIRSKNNAQQLAGLLQDIKQQVFDGAVEVIVVDTESHDETPAVAKKFGARIVPIKQAEFSYPRALNRGFEVATKPWVFSLVDHSALSNRYVLKTATRWNAQSNVAAVWAFSLPNANATIWEQFGYMLIIDRKLAAPAHVVVGREAHAPGLLAANDLLVRHAAWKAVGGFDERYGAGGEDSALGRSLLKAGYELVYDPGLSVYHTHGLGFTDNFRQGRYWLRLAKPLDFDLTTLRRHRSDL